MPIPAPASSGTRPTLKDFDVTLSKGKVLLPALRSPWPRRLSRTGVLEAHSSEPCWQAQVLRGPTAPCHPGSVCSRGPLRCLRRSSAWVPSRMMAVMSLGVLTGQETHWRAAVSRRTSGPESSLTDEGIEPLIPEPSVLAFPQPESHRSLATLSSSSAQTNHHGPG